jgi:TetR/AcrR family transcriptional repressor of bet genes
LVKATIAEIGAAGSLDVTVARIAKRAGMSSALAHHYFGGKDQILVAAMRHILTLFGASLAFYVQAQTSPEARRLLEIYRRRMRSNLLAGFPGRWWGRAPR